MISFVFPFLAFFAEAVWKEQDDFDIFGWARQECNTSDLLEAAYIRKSVRPVLALLCDYVDSKLKFTATCNEEDRLVLKPNEETCAYTMWTQHPSQGVRGHKSFFLSTKCNLLSEYRCRSAFGCRGSKFCSNKCTFGKELYLSAYYYHTFYRLVAKEDDPSEAAIIYEPTI
eukprot:TRINITY_DN54285_c0_g1_i1.p1 TRINITY_DN54285_c0_g1~~TRINITY_DN54285_c0_g1_i1.p1  ORF type:complete len:171 (+),score=20.82 TRINITY_DN54285_c0_g1_i1:3-515(+)